MLHLTKGEEKNVMARDGACGQQEANALHGIIHLHITKKTRYLLRRLLDSGTVSSAAEGLRLLSRQIEYSEVNTEIVERMDL